MKIVIFSDTYAPQINGVSTVVRQTAQTLNRLGHETTVITVSASKRSLAGRPADGFAVVRLPSLPFWGYQGERFTAPLGLTLGAVKRFKPDIIHVHTPFAVGWEAVWCAKHFGLPLVGTHHTFLDYYLKHISLDFTWTKELSWHYVTGFYNRCDRILSPSRALADELSDKGLRKPIAVLPNPVNLGTFKPAADPEEKESFKQRFGLAGPIIAYMGRLSYEKSLDQVLAAFALVAAKAPAARLVLIGDGPEAEPLRGLIAKLGLENRTVFTGPLFGQDLRQALAASDVFVTASKSENHPVSVLEAMAAGLPIVAVRANGLPEIVTSGKNGLLCQPDRPDRLAEHLLALLADEPQRQRLAAGARQRALDFSEDKIVADLLGHYRELIGSNS